MSSQDNFFTNELSEYYSGQGKSLSDQVIQVLNKSPLDLTEEDKETYKNLILPTRQSRKQAFAEMLKQPESNGSE